MTNCHFFYFLALATYADIVTPDVPIKPMPTIPIVILNDTGAIPQNIIVAPVKANKIPNVNSFITMRFLYITIKFFNVD